MGDNLDEEFYLNLIEDFIATGKITGGGGDDCIYEYIVSLMVDPTLQAMVLSDEVQAQIFRDNMMRFVDACLKRSKFQFNRKQAEQTGMRETLEWSEQKRRDGWKAMLAMLDNNYGQYGFRSTLYRNMFQDNNKVNDNDVWESLYKDYQAAFALSMQQLHKDHIQQEGEKERKKLDKELATIPQYLDKHNVSTDDFKQAWGLMGGMWDEYEFERYMRIISRQHSYPVIIELANAMGRTLDSLGKSTMWVGSGNAYSIEHSSRSDIQGVTVSNRIDSLLPVEMVQISDEDFEELFLMKYATSKLQNFLHKSEQFNPNKKLERKRAKQKGPMIACIDTSGSMVGWQEDVARSLLIRLVDIAKTQHRHLYIIAYSVSAKPIDAIKERAKLLQFFSTASTGDTNATQMVTHTLDILDQKADFMSADVVLIGDFKMKLVSDTLLNRILLHRQSGTFFYGLQTGADQKNVWKEHLDKVFVCER